MARPVLELNQLRLRYPKSKNWSLNGFDLRLDTGETLALVGSSGCGKSTVARAIMQLLPQGTICEGGLELTGKDPRRLDRAALRRLRGQAVGLVFQDPMTRLNPLMPAGAHILDILKAHRPATNPKWRKTRALNLLERVGISTRRFRAYPHELSGGMRQRLAIALAIALEPPLLIADEPTTSLDVAVASQMMAELSELCRELGSALLLISHDLAMAARWCDRTVILSEGRRVEEGPSDQLLTRPRSSVGQRLVYSARTRERRRFYQQPKTQVILSVDTMRCWHAVGGTPWSPAWFKAIDEVSFDLLVGESLGIVGASGCGKSTLCRALIGLQTVRGGSVKLFGEDLLCLRGEKLRFVRRAIQMVFQDPLACLNPAFNVTDAITDPLLIHRLYSKAAAREQARQLLKQVGLNPFKQFKDRFPRQLSGGQQQRVAIARALALKPKVLICDESVSMLDAEVQTEILNLLKQLQQNLGLSILFITHDLSLASGFCHRVIVLDRGHIVEEGPGDRIFQAPQSKISRALVEACPKLPH
ncbi:ABC transporter ATP-binding protein [Synechococcus sp. M16CYN]|uniref:ABC transporter ATP-binding protein n=1 Tax=Synechococcus sp. M16CYN TaxID=3103139 RepID=UPI0032560723